MFDGLFDDDAGDSKRSPTSSAKATVKDTAPRCSVDDFTSSKLVGISNQGATCYLNSLIQTLFLTPELRGA